MPQETYLERKLRQLGLSQDPHSSPSTAKKLSFRLYFPRPPYGPVQYSAAKQGDGLNFVGQLLGHGGCTLKKIQTDSGARVEVHDGKGNLNGTHPSYTDPSLHAVVFADSREKLNAAARMIAEVLQPVDAVFERFDVVPGGSALLKPAVKKEASHRSPRSETSSRSRGGVWGGGASTPSSENDSSPAADLDSAYVQETSSPWRNAKSMSVPTYKPPKPEDKTLQQSKSAETKKMKSDVKEWDTWGRNGSDCYHQFTVLTQNLVSQCARSRQMKQNWENEYYTDRGRQNGRVLPVWGPVESKLNGSNLNQSMTPGIMRVERPRTLDDRTQVHVMEGYPLPHVYEDLIGRSDTPRRETAAPQESRLTSAYQIASPDSELPTLTTKRMQRYVSLPQDL